MEKGLILNTSYNDFILGTHVSDYFDKIPTVGSKSSTEELVVRKTTD